MLVNRMLRAARLDPRVFSELERDRNATSQALVVVIIVSIANGVGQFISYMLDLQVVTGFTSLIGGIAASLLGWIVWSFVTYNIGTRLMRGRATPGELLRCIGFAYTPNILGFFGFIPCLGWLAVLIGLLWTMVAVIVALREALDFSSAQAIATAFLGFVTVVVLRAVFAIVGLGFPLAFR